MKGNKFNYQIVLVFSPKTEEKNREKVLAKVEKWLADNMAKIEKQEHTGSKDLIYEIAGFRKGDFWQLEVVGEKPVKLTDLNLYLNREVNVIRYLILKK